MESENISFKPINSGVKSYKRDKTTKPNELKRNKKKLPEVTSQDYLEFVDYLE